MKRIIIVLGLILLLALAACDTMGPTTQEALPTDIAGATPAAPADQATVSAPTGETGEGQTETPGANLQGVTWEWVSLLDPMGQTTAVDPTRYTVIFNPDGTANVKADCNSVTANYLTDGVNLTIQLGASTAVACPEDTQDVLFLNSLGAAESYVVEDGELFITLRSAAGTLIFRTGAGSAAGQPDQASPTLTGVTWEWVQAVTSVETIDVVDPTRYTITFNDDGTANIKADCNNVLAAYTAGSDGSMTLTMGPSTLMACPEDSQVNPFLAGLGVVGAYSFDGADLLLRNIAADGGVLRFRAGGGTAEPAPAGDILTGVVWQWVSTTTPTEEIVVADPTRYTIIFNEDGTAGIKADCNVGNATYTAGEDGSISIILGVSTLAFCENSQDQQFRSGLSAAALYFFQDGDLYIDQFASSGTMRFANGGAPEAEPSAPATDTLTGVTWQWVKTMTPVEEIVAVDPARYTVVFNEDGTANITADCNVGTATYTTGEGGTITITPGAMTLAMCPPDSQATQFMTGLSAAAIYFFQDGNLLIDLFAGSGTMHFAPAGDTVEGSVPGKGTGGTTVAPATALVGPKWQANNIVKPDGTITFNDPTRYTVTFNADGTANVQADCNTAVMGYTAGADGSLTMTPGPMTMAACPPGSMDQYFLGGLTNAMGYRLEGGSLLIDMLYESGTMSFSAAQ